MLIQTVSDTFGMFVLLDFNSVDFEVCKLCLEWSKESGISINIKSALYTHFETLFRFFTYYRLLDAGDVLTSVNQRYRNFLVVSRSATNDGVELAGCYRAIKEAKSTISRYLKVSAAFLLFKP